MQMGSSMASLTKGSSATGTLSSSITSSPLLYSLVGTVRHVVKSARATQSTGPLIITPSEIGPIKKILDQIGIADMGMVSPVHRHMQPVAKNSPGEAQEVHYMSVAEDQDYHVGVFVLPPRTKIPLHDHPGMCVLSRLLCGSLNVKDFDWHNPKRRIRVLSLAVLTSHQWIHQPTTLELFKDCRNVHEFEAGDDGCAILDVIIPPYDADEGRPCRYYRAVLQEERPTSSTTTTTAIATATTERNEDSMDIGDNDERGGGKPLAQQPPLYRLIPVDQPEHFDVISGEYVGPLPATNHRQTPTSSSSAVGKGVGMRGENGLKPPFGI